MLLLVSPLKGREMMSSFIVSDSWNAGHLSPPRPAEKRWKQTLRICWSALKGPHLCHWWSSSFQEAPGGSPASRWRHRSKTIMVRLAWARAQSPGDVASSCLFCASPFPEPHSLRVSNPMHFSFCVLPSSDSPSFKLFLAWHTETHFLGSYAFQKVQEAPCTELKNWVEQQGEY